MAKMETKPIDIRWLVVMNFMVMGWVVLSLWKPTQIPALVSLKTETAMVIVTIVIAASSAFTAWTQHKQHKHDKKVANVNHQFALYEKRLEAYEALDEFNGSFMKSGSVDLKDHNVFVNKITYLMFLLPEQQEGYIKEFRKKSFDAAIQHRRWSRLVGKRLDHGLSDNEELQIDDAFEKMTANEEWIYKQWSEGKIYEEFEPLLRIPNEI